MFFQNPKSVFADRIPEILNLEAGSWIIGKMMNLKTSKPNLDSFIIV